MMKAGQCGRIRRISDDGTNGQQGDCRLRRIQGGQCSAERRQLWKKRTWFPVQVRPRSSLIWLAKMMTAIPDVNPTVTGKGMYLIYVPSLRSPIARRMTPDSIVARISPSIPCCSHGRSDQHDEGARWPADLEPAAAERRHEEAADDRGVEAAVGGDA